MPGKVILGKSKSERVTQGSRGSDQLMLLSHSGKPRKRSADAIKSLREAEEAIS